MKSELNTLIHARRKSKWKSETVMWKGFVSAESKI